MTPEATVKDYLMLHFIVAIWSFTTILGLLISIPSLEIVFYRTLMATAILGGLLVWQRTSLRMPYPEMMKALGTGCVVCLHWLLFFWAARVSNASVCLAGMATTSLWTALIEPLVNKKKVKWYEIFLGLMVVSGLYIIFRFEFDYWIGLSMAILSALLGAIFMVINGRLTKRHEPYTLTFLEMSGAFLFAGLLMPLYACFLAQDGLQLVPSTMDWLWLFLLSGACTVYAFSVSVELMRRLTAFAINLTVNLEPVYGILLAVLIFGDSERMTTEFYLGTLVILLSVLMYPVFNYLHRRRYPSRMH